MTVDYEIRRPVDPFKKRSWGWVAVIVVLVLAFTIFRMLHSAPAVPPAPSVQEAPPVNVTPEPVAAPVVAPPPPPVPILTVDDLQEPEFPTLDRELGDPI